VSQVEFFCNPLAPDHEQVRRAIDAAPIEELLDALVRRAERALSLARAAYHQAELEIEPERMADLVRRCEASAKKCRAFSHALRALAPNSAQDERAFNIALDVAALAVMVVPGRAGAGHA
jgi:hypothetical protein